MKKMIIAMSVISLFLSSCDKKEEVKVVKEEELRPSQKVMRARAAWLKAMNENLAAGKFAEVAMDADALAAQTKKVAEGLQDERKDFNLKVSGLADETSKAAGKKSGDVVKAKLADIKATCGACHAKFRDKK